MGPVILDVLGTQLAAAEKDLLQHPLVGGVILFSRNFEMPEQISALCKEIRNTNSELIISVDHEGGRVQRFKEGFTQLPAMGTIGERFMTAPQQAIKCAYACGWLMGSELAAVGIDFSFAPVLDLDINNNPAISTRSFHTDPHITITLATALMDGMHDAGMPATGKHFPGHGAVKIDSHLDLPEDTRSFEQIEKNDLRPFAALIEKGIDAIMPGHILFSQVDKHPVTFSSYWLTTILRTRLNFSGLIISDDLNMKGASRAPGDYAMNAQKALQAGCDAVLICNNRAAAIEILDSLTFSKKTNLNKMQRKTPTPSLKLLHSTPKWQDLHAFITTFSTQEIS